MGITTEREPLLRGFCEENLEPAWELCVKMQRKSALTIKSECKELPDMLEVSVSVTKLY